MNEITLNNVRIARETKLAEEKAETDRLTRERLTKSLETYRAKIEEGYALIKDAKKTAKAFLKTTAEIADSELEVSELVELGNLAEETLVQMRAPMNNNRHCDAFLVGVGQLHEGGIISDRVKDLKEMIRSSTVTVRAL